MLKNNNPGNIRPGNDYTGETGNRAGFSVFISMAMGIRAYFMNLHAAREHHGRKTIEAYITAYAPPSENDTDKYISDMCQGLGIGPNEQFPLDRDFLLKFARVQFKIEDVASVEGVTDSDISDGLQLFENDVPGWVQE